MSFSQMTADEHPPTPPPCRWPAFITLPTLAKFHLVWRRLCDVVLSRSSCLFEHTLTAVCVLPEYQPGRKYNVHSKFCEHLNVLYVFHQTCILLKPGWSSTARILRFVVSPPYLCPSQYPTPPPSRWPALITSPPLAKFQLVWRRLCEALLSSFITRQKHPYLLSSLCLNAGDIYIYIYVVLP